MEKIVLKCKNFNVIAERNFAFAGGENASEIGFKAALQRTNLNPWEAAFRLE